jgi:diacylglycerol O-acyltransferase
VQETFERAVERVPRFRQLVAPPRREYGRLRWVEDPAFSLDYHLRRVRAPLPGSMRTVLDLAAPAATSALDPARPLWECTVVEGLEGGRAAFVLKFHHTLTDGVGGIDLASAVFDRDPEGGAPAKPEPASRPSRNPFERFVGAAATGASALGRPVRTATTAAHFGRSVARMLAPVPDGLSPLFISRGLDRRLDTLEVPMTELRAAADAVGCTINDVFLAAAGGALHDFHQRLGMTVPSLRITMPISVRATGDAPGGNHFTPARFELPVDDPDPAVRARIAASIAHRWRVEPAVGVTDVLANALDRLPPPLVTRLFGSMLKNIDLDAVDLQGLREPAYLGGASIDRLWAFAPPTGAAVSITLLSHLATGCVGVVSDLAAVPEPELLTTCLEGGFDQVRSLASNPPRTVAS